MALSDDDIVRVTIVSHNDRGALLTNSLHYVVKGDTAFTGNEPTIADVCTEVWNHISTEYRALLATTFIVDRIHGYQEVETWNGQVAGAGDVSVNLAGTMVAGSGSVPRPVASVLDLKSDVASRSARGWIMLPGPTNNTYIDSDGSWTNAYNVLANALGAKLDDTIQHDVLGVHAWHVNPIIYSRTRRKHGESLYYFGVKSAINNDEPRWVSRRRSIP